MRCSDSEWLGATEKNFAFSDETKGHRPSVPGSTVLANGRQLQSKLPAACRSSVIRRRGRVAELAS
jgi:hypothetical protein